MILFFRLIIAALALLSFYTGYLGFRYGAVNSYYGFPDYPLYTHGSVILDSNFRFYNGLWFGVGLLLCWVFYKRQKTFQCDDFAIGSVCFRCNGPFSIASHLRRAFHNVCFFLAF